MLNTESNRHLTPRRTGRAPYEPQLPLQCGDVIVPARAEVVEPRRRSLWMLPFMAIGYLAMLVVGVAGLALFTVGAVLFLLFLLLMVALFVSFLLLLLPLLLAVALFDSSEPQPRAQARARGLRERAVRPRPRRLRPQPCTEGQPCDLAVRLAFRYPGWDHRDGSRVQATG